MRQLLKPSSSAHAQKRATVNEALHRNQRTLLTEARESLCSKEDPEQPKIFHYQVKLLKKPSSKFSLGIAELAMLRYIC